MLSLCKCKTKSKLIQELYIGTTLLLCSTNYTNGNRKQACRSTKKVSFLFYFTFIHSSFVGCHYFLRASSYFRFYEKETINELRSGSSLLLPVSENTDWFFNLFCKSCFSVSFLRRQTLVSEMWVCVNDNGSKR